MTKKREAHPDTAAIVRPGSNVPQWLHGFDARRIPSPPWSEKRRNTYAIRTDVASPLSSDPLVWPSVFDQGVGIGLSPALRAEMGLSGLELPAWVGRHGPSWDSLERLEEALGERAVQLPGSVRLMAITKLCAEDAAEPRFVPRDGWLLLGFDVSDAGLISALCNCGYSDREEVEQSRSRWAHALNEHHLFDGVDQALAFKVASDERVPEHAPFDVYGLWIEGGSP